MERRYPAGRRACGRCEMMMTYRAVVKDNQWWYAGHSDGQRLDTEDAVTLIIDGRPCPMRHAAIGRDGRVTRSFVFVDVSDRSLWISQRGRVVTLDVHYGPPRRTISTRPTSASPPRRRRRLRGAHGKDDCPAQKEPAVDSRPIVRADAETLFDAYIFADWSSTSIPSSGPDSIWAVDAWFENGDLWEDTTVLVNPRTRREAEVWIAGRIMHHRSAGRRVLIGFDFALGYPEAALRRLLPGFSPNWSALWAHLEQHIKDDATNANNRFSVAAALNYALEEKWFWGCPPRHRGPWLEPTRSEGRLNEFRVVEETLRARGKRAFSVRQLLGNGSVGSQVLVGVPVCHRLRLNPGLQLCVWPFETGLNQPPREIGRSGVLAEIWPGAIDVDFALHPVRDAAQMLAYGKWAATHDVAGTLGGFFTPRIAPRDRDTVGNVEGWILGA